MKQETINSFLKRFYVKHKNKYDYSFAKFIKCDEKIEIICKEHGPFWQTPSNHCSYGCPACGGVKKGTTKNFIEKAKQIHKEEYDYSLVNYINKYTKVKIICRKHGIFEQRPNCHIHGTHPQGCPVCSGKQKLTSFQIVEKAQKIHGDSYEYDLNDYVSNKRKIKIFCKKCKSFFYQSIHNHIDRLAGCPKCANSRKSKISQEWLDYSGIQKENREVTLYLGNRKYIVDGFDIKTNTIYEFLGDFWHGNPNRYRLDEINDITKKTFRELYEETNKRKIVFLSHGYNVIFIWEYDWKIIKTNLPNLG